jgi:hypothetical protein
MWRSLVVRVVALIVLAGCGGGGGDDGGNGDPIDASVDGADVTGLCAGRPCRTSIDTIADWAAVSAPLVGRRCELVEDAKYLAPAVPAAALQQVVFQDVKVHRLHLSFMTQVLAEYFGGLSPQMYQALVQRRATRQYWAGALYRITDIQGATIGYGFDVIVDPALYEEQLTETELLAIEAILEARFHLPLVYAPTEPTAIYRSYSFDELEHHVPRACQIVACADPARDCVQVPAAVTLCGHFLEGRTVAAEHAAKTRLTATAGTYALPRAVGVHTVPAIFGGGEHGPARTPITPAAATARYEVIDHGSLRTRRYTQDLTSGGDPVELSWDVRLPETGGGLLVAEPHIGDHVELIAAFDGGQTQDGLARLSSCSNETLQPWRITGALPDGDGFVLDIRYLPPAAGSGPLFPMRADVTLDGVTAAVTEYTQLVYAGEHHNWNNQYWILFSPPITYAGHDVSGLWLDEQAYMSQLEAAWTLDASLAPLDRLTVTSYTVSGPP